jgi:cytidine deaminase
MLRQKVAFNFMLHSLIDSLPGLDRAVAARLRAAVAEPAFSGEVDGIAAREAASLLPLATAFSIHPISGIAVGAVALGQSGRLYPGANMEFPGMPLNVSLHAEQSALLNAWMHDEHEVVALHVSAMPCGHCRQFMRELTNADTLQIHVQERTYTLEELLPQAFGQIPTKGHGLLDSRPAALEAAQSKPDADLSVQRAINAAQRSYAPYSRSPEGFVIECLDGHFYSGRAAESIAFNPSVPSVLVALNQRNLSSSRMVAITKATQAKLATAINNPLPFGRALIHSISKAKVDVVQMEVR